MSAIPGVKGAPPPPPPQPPGFIKFLQHVVGIAGAATGAMAPGSGEGIGAIDQNIATAPSSLADVFDFGGWMAEGGDVTPGKFYGWQEDGQEYFAPSVAGRIIPERSMGGGGNTFNYNVDARGADLGAQNRIARGIEASHDAAVANAVRANHEMSMRRPQRGSKSE